jgi:hypothetical protein
VDASGSGQGLFAVFCEQGNESSGSVRGGNGEFLELLSHY